MLCSLVAQITSLHIEVKVLPVGFFLILELEEDEITSRALTLPLLRCLRVNDFFSSWKFLKRARFLYRRSAHPFSPLLQRRITLR